MRIFYLPAAVDDLVWFRSYYTRVFPAGDIHARKQFTAVRKALLAHPALGKIIDSERQVFEFSIPRTPFSIIYHVQGEDIRVLRVWDGRRHRPVAP